MATDNSATCQAYLTAALELSRHQQSGLFYNTEVQVLIGFSLKVPLQFSLYECNSPQTTSNGSFLVLFPSQTIFYIIIT